MREYTHVAGALLLYASIAFLINLPVTIAGLFFAGWISLFPDIVDRLLGEHRGIGHSIFWVIPFILIGFFNYLLAFALIIGFTSHLFFDIFTTHGCPILYPFIKTSFVSLSMRNRIKTGTNIEKAVFIFILILLIPTLLFTTGHFFIWTLQGDNTPLGTGEASGVPSNGYSIKTPFKHNINLNLNLNANSTKNITIQEVNENQTSILVNDLT